MDNLGIVNSWLTVFRDCVKDGVFNFTRWEEHCRESANAGANSCRILAYAPWEVKPQELYCPYAFDVVQGAWNLDVWHNSYFETLRWMVTIALAYNLKVWFSLFDNCQFHHGTVAPWSLNVQDRDGYYADVQRSLKWVDKVFGILGNDVSYEIVNEGEPKGDMKKAVNWYVAIYERLMALKVPEENICWGATPHAKYADGKWEDDRPRNLLTQVLSALKGLPGKLQCYRSMHNVGVPTAEHPASYAGAWATAWWGGNHTGKAFLSDDGVGNGAAPLDEYKGMRRPSGDQWYRIAKVLIANDGGKVGKWWIEHCPKNYAAEAWLPAIRGIVKAYAEKYGYPENWGKYPKPVEPPPIEPGPITPPPAPEPTTCGVKHWWEHLKTWNFKAAWEHLFGKHNA